MRSKFILVVFVILPCVAHCQTFDTTGMVRYSSDYKFIDGVFLNYEQVLINRPVSDARIVSSLNPDDLDYYNELVKKEMLQYINDSGITEKVPVKEIWGYCRKGVLYINHNDEFNRIPIVGSVCHFIAESIVMHEPMPDPYFRNYPGSPKSYSTSEVRQYLFDFKSGRVFDYNIQSLEIILMSDPELYDEYVIMKRREKKQKRFLYLRKYNERNPLYLPIKK